MAARLGIKGIVSGGQALITAGAEYLAQLGIMGFTSIALPAAGMVAGGVYAHKQYMKQALAEKAHVESGESERLRQAALEAKYPQLFNQPDVNVSVLVEKDGRISIETNSFQGKKEARVIDRGNFPIGRARPQSLTF
jgi:hypothetical protein